MRRITFLFVLLLSLTGCGKEGSVFPPKMRYGSEPCSECHMLISDERFSAAILLGSGLYEKFDDIGCLFQRLKSNLKHVEEIWVSDYVSKKWVKAHYAYYMVQKSVQTPMGYGILAFSNEQEALGFSGESGPRAFKFDELQSVLEKH